MGRGGNQRPNFRLAYRAARTFLIAITRRGPPRVVTEQQSEATTHLDSPAQCTIL